MDYVDVGITYNQYQEIAQPYSTPGPTAGAVGPVLPSRTSLPAPSHVSFSPSSFQKLMMADLECIVSTDELASTVILYYRNGTSQVTKGIFQRLDAHGDGGVGISTQSSEPVLYIPFHVLTGEPYRGMYLIVEGREYALQDIEKNASGMYTFRLRNR